MEPHPVPQDILYAEFKLFGSFTLKQFLKLVMGCLVALIFFSLPIPIIIKIPLVIIILLVTLGIAAVPRFEQKFGNFVKAVFISPRYIWIKDSRVPEILSTKPTKTTDKIPAISAAKAKNKVDLSKISVETLLDAKEKERNSVVNRSTVKGGVVSDKPVNESVEGDNFDRVYNAIYQSAAAKQIVQNQQSNQKIQNTETNQSLGKQKTREEYIKEIRDLKSLLSQVSKSPNSKEQETQIMNKINDLLIELKALGLISQTQTHQQGQFITNSQGKPEIYGQLVSGIVVDKMNKPIPNAKILFDDVGGNRDIIAITDRNGRFVSREKLIEGQYDITVEYPGKRFHTYRIQVTKDKLPMYKLREK